MEPMASSKHELITDNLKLQDYEHLLREFYYDQHDENKNDTGAHGEALVETEVPELDETVTEKRHMVEPETISPKNVEKKLKNDPTGTLTVKKELVFDKAENDPSSKVNQLRNGKKSEVLFRETIKEVKSVSETTTELHCGRCDKTFASHQKFYLHKRRHNIIDSGRFKCNYCSKSFGSSNELIFHVTNPSKNVPNKVINPQHKQEIHCPVCKQWFLSHDELKVHYSTHNVNGSSTYCAKCDKKFTTLARFKIHIRRHRNVDLGLFTCTWCKTAFASKMEQVLHEQNKHKLKLVTKESSSNEQVYRAQNCLKIGRSSESPRMTSSD